MMLVPSGAGEWRMPLSLPSSTTIEPTYPAVLIVIVIVVVVLAGQGYDAAMILSVLAAADLLTRQILQGWVPKSTPRSAPGFAPGPALDGPRP